MLGTPPPHLKEKPCFDPRKVPSYKTNSNGMPCPGQGLLPVKEPPRACLKRGMSRDKVTQSHLQRLEEQCRLFADDPRLSGESMLKSDVYASERILMLVDVDHVNLEMVLLLLTVADHMHVKLVFVARGGTYPRDITSPWSKRPNVSQSSSKAGVERTIPPNGRFSVLASSTTAYASAKPENDVDGSCPSLKISPMRAERLTGYLLGLPEGYWKLLALFGGDEEPVSCSAIPFNQLFDIQFFHARLSAQARPGDDPTDGWSVEIVFFLEALLIYGFMCPQHYEHNERMHTLTSAYCKTSRIDVKELRPTQVSFSYTGICRAQSTDQTTQMLLTRMQAAKTFSMGYLDEYPRSHSECVGVLRNTDATTSKSFSERTEKYVRFVNFGFDRDCDLSGDHKGNGECKNIPADQVATLSMHASDCERALPWSAAASDEQTKMDVDKKQNGAPHKVARAGNDSRHTSRRGRRSSQKLSGKAH